MSGYFDQSARLIESRCVVKESTQHTAIFKQHSIDLKKVGPDIAISDRSDQHNWHIVTTILYMASIVDTRSIHMAVIVSEWLSLTAFLGQQKTLGPYGPYKLCNHNPVFNPECFLPDSRTKNHNDPQNRKQGVKNDPLSFLWKSQVFGPHKQNSDISHDIDYQELQTFMIQTK